MDQGGNEEGILKKGEIEQGGQILKQGGWRRNIEARDVGGQILK